MDLMGKKGKVLIFNYVIYCPGLAVSLCICFESTKAKFDALKQGDT